MGIAHSFWHVVVVGDGVNYATAPIHRTASLASRAEDPGFESRLRRDFYGSSHTGDLKIGTPMATLPGAWRYMVSAGTGLSGVSVQ